MESLKRVKKDEEGRKVLQSWSLWVSSEIVGQKIGRKIHNGDAVMMVLVRGIFKKVDTKVDTRMMTVTVG